MASSITTARSGVTPKHLCSLQKGIGRWLTRKTLCDKHIAIDAHIEKVVDFCRLQDRLAILTRRHYRGFHTNASQILEEGDRAGVGFDAGRREQLVNQFVFDCRDRRRFQRSGRSSGVPSGNAIPRDFPKSRAPSYRGFPSTWSL